MYDKNTVLDLIVADKFFFYRFEKISCRCRIKIEAVISTDFTEPRARNFLQEFFRKNF